MQTILEINILDADLAFGNALGIGEFAGGILITIILFVTFSSLAIYKKNTMAVFVIGILTLCFSIAVGWLSIFVLIVVIFLLALGVADKLTSILGGHLSGGS